MKLDNKRWSLKTSTQRFLVKTIMIGTIAEYVFLVMNISYLVYMMLKQRKRLKNDPKFKREVEEKGQLLIFKFVDPESLKLKDEIPNSVSSKNKVKVIKSRRKLKRVKQIKPMTMDLGNGATFKRSDSGTITLNMGKGVKIQIKDPHNFPQNNNPSSDCLDDPVSGSQPISNSNLTLKKGNNNYSTNEKRPSIQDLLTDEIDESNPPEPSPFNSPPSKNITTPVTTNHKKSKPTPVRPIDFSSKVPEKEVPQKEYPIDLNDTQRLSRMEQVKQKMKERRRVVNRFLNKM